MTLLLISRPKFKASIVTKKNYYEMEDIISFIKNYKNVFIKRRIRKARSKLALNKAYISNACQILWILSNALTVERVKMNAISILDNILYASMEALSKFY
jgi:hypothetical protein